MTISNRVSSYLNEHDIHYQVISHSHSTSSIGSAISAHVPLDNIAKAVILKDHEDRKLMAILPAKNKISISALNEQLFASYQLLKESEVYQMFGDCEHGAVPPLSDAYNMACVCDELLDNLDDIYIESGDHLNLLHLKHQDFETMVANARHMRFSHEVFH